MTSPADRPLPAHAQTIADLKAARALIAKGWTRGFAARDGRYCLIGAMDKATGGDWMRYGDAHFVLATTLGSEELATFNDAQPSKRPVLAAIDATIARLGGEA